MNIVLILAVSTMLFSIRLSAADTNSNYHVNLNSLDISLNEYKMKKDTNMISNNNWWNVWGKTSFATTGGAGFGSLIGVAIGSFVPGIGTVLGGVVGGFSGGTIGFLIVKSKRKPK